MRAKLRGVCEIEKVFSSEGSLAAVVPDFRARAGQIETIAL
jgi:hypothetical protein